LPICGQRRVEKIIGNLLTNSSFERGLEGFSGGASFIKVIDAQSPNSGSKILSCGAGTGTVSQSIAVTKDRTYKIGAFARQSGTVVDNQSNNKLRIGTVPLAGSLSRQTFPLTRPGRRFPDLEGDIW
jgi:hypothetical protein